MEKSDKLVAKAKKIKWFFTDVDGTLTDGWVYYSADGEQLKAFSLRDGTGFFLLRQIGVKTGIITTECSPIVEQRAKKLKVDAYIYGTEKKKDVMRQFLEENHLSWDEIAYIGDERKGIIHSRRHFANSPALKGLHDFKQTRIALLQAGTRDEVFRIMDKIVEQWG